MSLTHFSLALLVTFIWGTNFVVIHFGLQFFPPFLYAALRFVFTFLPWCFFFKRPNVPWRFLLANGIFLGVGQFGFLFWALQGHIAPGIASLVVQSQIFFSLILAFLIFKEVPNKFQILALLICVIGFTLIASDNQNSEQTNITTLGLILALMAAFSWGCSNMVARKLGKVNMMNFLIWGGLFSCIPLLGMSFWFDGSKLIFESIQNANFAAWLSVLWQSIGNTLLGFGVWFWLIKKYDTATIAPLSLLVPVFGMLSAYWLLDEKLTTVELIAAFLIMLGLGANILITQIIKKQNKIE
ncbi:EamA family transporter [Thorsellia anophelis]|uniref:O-acetylserine/cysteine efflux transporter n=1 Tax=Thorsellia anophelis DSM 18579 TaxID=1123402 RepID=A0A1I0EV43_9GAMM|nr:EamA family transporter [Thorsellia anophelis]SET48749.1 O-acetylserine/cysteine efflux transporter [Thorsellia anophelis DSM 18579]